LRPIKSSIIWTASRAEWSRSPNGEPLLWRPTPLLQAAVQVNHLINVSNVRNNGHSTSANVTGRYGPRI
jgi:hypothetical protein